MGTTGLVVLRPQVPDFWKIIPEVEVDQKWRYSYAFFFVMVRGYYILKFFKGLSL